MVSDAVLSRTKTTWTGSGCVHARQYEDARKHFEDVIDVTESDLPFLGKLGQTRRFRTAARTGLGEVALAEQRYEEAAKLFEDAAESAEKKQTTRSNVAGRARTR